VKLNLQRPGVRTSISCFDGPAHWGNQPHVVLRLFDISNEILWHLPAKQLCLAPEMHMKKNTLVII